MDKLPSDEREREREREREGEKEREKENLLIVLHPVASKELQAYACTMVQLE